MIGLKNKNMQILEGAQLEGDYCPKCGKRKHVLLVALQRQIKGQEAQLAAVCMESNKVMDWLDKNLPDGDWPHSTLEEVVGNPTAYLAAHDREVAQAAREKTIEDCLAYLVHHNQLHRRTQAFEGLRALAREGGWLHQNVGGGGTE
jgi:hypothetical protein